MSEKIKVIAIAGPTASGKTSLAVYTAKKLGGQVISNDSMQIYRGMEIGTAAPTKEETGGVPHHLIGFLSPDEDFSCAEYKDLATKKIEEINESGSVPVFCGGTGLYLDSVLKISDYSESVKNENLRAELLEYYKVYGADALHGRLQRIDPEAASAIHKNNVRRVIRAIEIYETTGITKTEWDIRSKSAPSPYDAKIFVLDFLSRELLYERIDKRVDIMMSEGLEAEVRALYEKGLLSPDTVAFQAIGYKEFIPYFKGEISIDGVAESIKLATRHYAKRQITWFKRNRDAVFLHPDREDGTIKSTEELFLEMEKYI